MSLAVPQRGKISLVVAPRQVIDIFTDLLATLALHGRVIVVDGGNLFDGYGLARALRKYTPNVETLLKNVQLSRSFTCYQMLALLKDFPVDGTPVIILDLLATFLDESVALTRRRSLLIDSLDQLGKISAHSPVALWVRLRSTPTGDDEALLPLVRAIAENYWKVVEPQPLTYQLSLF
ncbi:hypothetical protein KQH56_02670 [bacterium]|nr:hypothetical protein [bacterium]